MKKVFITLALAVTTVAFLNACTVDEDKSYEEINAIDNDEVDDEEI